MSKETLSTNHQDGGGNAKANRSPVDQVTVEVVGGPSLHQGKEAIAEQAQRHQDKVAIGNQISLELIVQAIERVVAGCSQQAVGVG